MKRILPLSPRRLAVGLLCVLAPMLLLASPAGAVPGYAYGWTYAYDHYSGGLWAYSQSTVDSARWWPVPPYSSSSNYYRLGTSLDFAFTTAIAAAATTWSNQDLLFHFYVLPLGDNSTDHTLGMSDLGSGGPIAATWGQSVWTGTRAEVGNWWIRFNTRNTWCNGAYSGQADRQSKATHEFGHTIRLMDLDGQWSDSVKPTMYGWWGLNTIGERSLASGDITGITSLY